MKSIIKQNGYFQLNTLKFNDVAFVYRKKFSSTKGGNYKYSRKGGFKRSKIRKWNLHVLMNCFDPMVRRPFFTIKIWFLIPPYIWRNMCIKYFWTVGFLFMSHQWLISLISQLLATNIHHLIASTASLSIWQLLSTVRPLEHFWQIYFEMH